MPVCALPVSRVVSALQALDALFMFATFVLHIHALDVFVPRLVAFHRVVRFPMAYGQFHIVVLHLSQIYSPTLHRSMHIMALNGAAWLQIMMVVVVIIIPSVFVDSVEVGLVMVAYLIAVLIITLDGKAPDVVFWVQIMMGILVIMLDVRFSETKGFM